MTEIEKKALALVNEVGGELGWDETKEIHKLAYTRNDVLFRAIEQHEAFRQEVSDAIAAYVGTDNYLGKFNDTLGRFIIAKPDPLVEALDECGFGVSSNAADDIRAALAARGLKIVEDK